MNKTYTKAYVFIDIETSVDPEAIEKMEKPPVIAISAMAVDYETLEVLEVFNKRIKFRMDIADPKILQLIGYTDEKWADAEPPATVARQFSEWVDKYRWHTKEGQYGPYQTAIAGGHNCDGFDIPVLKKWYAALGKHYRKKFYLSIAYQPSIDTLTLARNYQLLMGEFFISNRLPNLCDKLGIEHGEHHDPLSDVRASVDLFRFFKSHMVASRKSIPDIVDEARKV